MMIVNKIQRRWRRAVSGDAGMSTVEYAIGTIAAAAFAAVLYKVVTKHRLGSLISAWRAAVGVVPW